MNAGVESGRPEGLRAVRNLMPGSAGSVVQAGRIDRVVLTAAAEPVSLRVRVPCQVPAAKVRFVNRQRELSRARRWVEVTDGTSPRIVVVGGMPGVGKSALVRQVAESARGRYAGGALYVNFAELRDSPETAVSDALVSCLRALGVADEVVPTRLTDLANLFRSHTADEPVLVVLDDVTEPGQVRPLVPAALGSAVLITSTSRLPELSLDGAELLWLEPLDASSGQKLVKGVCRRAGAEPEALAELVEQCGRLPIALEVAAARLRDRPSLSVGALVREIEDSSRGLAALSIGGERTVSAVFTMSYRDLPDAARRMYRLLGVLPCRDFSVELAAVAAAVDHAVAVELLDRLVGAGLLTESAEGRFAFHGLVRRHAFDQAKAEVSEDDQDAARYRMARYLLIRTVYADLAIMGPARLRVTPYAAVTAEVEDPFRGADRKARALEWLDAERSNVLTAVRVAAGRGWHEMCWQLAESVSALYVVRRYLVDWTESAALGADSARVLENAAAEARLRSFVSRAWTDLGELDRAGQELRVALPLAETVGEKRLLASVWEMFARYYDQADPAEADRAYHTALELFAEAKDKRGVAFTTYFRGHSRVLRGRWPEALDTLLRARSLVDEFDDDRMRGRVRTSLGITLANLDRVTEAVAVLGEALELLGRYPKFEAQAQEALGDVVVGVGDLPRGRAALQRAWEIHVSLRSPDAERLRVKLAELSAS